MTRFEKDCIKERILNLARLKCTGTPKEMGAKFDINERTVKRLVREIRQEGFDLRFDYISMSYIKKNK
jgi:hypothetical protein